MTSDEHAVILTTMAKCSNHLRNFQSRLLFSTEKKKKRMDFHLFSVGNSLNDTMIQRTISVTLILGAIRETTLALSYQPTFLIALKQRAIALNQLKEFQRARTDIDLALSLAREWFSRLVATHNHRLHLVIEALDLELISLDEQWKSTNLNRYGKWVQKIALTKLLSTEERLASNWEFWLNDRAASASFDCGIRWGVSSQEAREEKRNRYVCLGDQQRDMRDTWTDEYRSYRENSPRPSICMENHPHSRYFLCS